MRIERAYRSQGFQSVSVISQLAFGNDRAQVAITWTVREGEQVTIDRVLINGNDAHLDRADSSASCTIRRGSPMSEEAMIESQRRLAELGLFRRVRITELPRTGVADARRARRRSRRPPPRPSTTAAGSRSAGIREAENGEAVRRAGRRRPRASSASAAAISGGRTDR